MQSQRRFMPHFTLIVLAITVTVLSGFPRIAAAQIDISYVDRQIKESRTLEFDYYSNFDYLRNAGSSGGMSNWNNRLVFNRNVEKTWMGNWQKVKFEVARYNNKGDRTQITQLDARFGGKRYLGNSPYFVYGVLEAKQHRVHPGPKTRDEDIFEGSGIYSFFHAGGGGGRVLDIAHDIRAMKVQDELRRRGLIAEELTGDIFNTARDILRQKKESTALVSQLESMLREMGILTAEKLDAETVFALSRLIDASADRLEKGLEWRIGVGNELSKQNSRMDRLRLVGGRVRYAKPLSERWGFVEEADYFQGFGADGNSNYLDSTSEMTYSMVKTTIAFTYRLRADTRTYTVTIDGEKDDYSYEQYFNELTASYSYEIYNRLHLSVIGKINRTDYDNDFQITSGNKGWNREFHALVNYEIF